MRIIAAIVAMVVASTFYIYLWEGAYYQLIALGICLLFWELKVKVKTIAAEIGFVLSLSNIADELFFDPKAIGINEYIFALIIILIIYKNHATTA